MWNVKIVDLWNKSGVNVCINRNIVECKGTKTSPFSVLSFVLIETLWNVKNGESLDVFTPADVLIETLWNVKISNGSNGSMLSTY